MQKVTIWKGTFVSLCNPCSLKEGTEILCRWPMNWESRQFLGHQFDAECDRLIGNISVTCVTRIPWRMERRHHIDELGISPICQVTDMMPERDRLKGNASVTCVILVPWRREQRLHVGGLTNELDSQLIYATNWESCQFVDHRGDAESNRQKGNSSVTCVTLISRRRERRHHIGDRWIGSLASLLVTGLVPNVTD